VGVGVQLGPLGTTPTKRPIVPAPGDDDGGEIGGMIGRGNRSTRRKPSPVPLCPPQTPHAARTRTRAAAVGNQRLTAWATARPLDPRFLHLGAGWRWVVNLTPRPLYPQGRNPRYPLERRLGSPQNWSGRLGEEKIFYPTGTRTPTPSVVQPVASRYTDCVIPAPKVKLSL
jgi:hypothetical protein